MSAEMASMSFGMTDIQHLIGKLLEPLKQEIAFLKTKVSVQEDKITILETELSQTKILLDASLKRTFSLEKSLFLHDSDGEIVFNENDEPVVSPALTIATEKPIEKETEKTAIIPETTLDLKACAVVEHLKEAVKQNEFGLFAIDKKGLDKFLTEEIAEDLRVKKVSRQLKKDIFKRAIELYSDIVYIVTSKSGNKTKSLALKPSVKRTDTYTSARLTGLGILG